MPNLGAFFSPASVAVVGVSTSPGNLGARIVGNLVDWGFAGAVHAVGRSGGRVEGHTLLRSVAELPPGVELACLLTPAPGVPDLLEELAARGVRAACIQSGGFSERDAGGRALAERVLAVARARGLRLIGPNCLGTLSTASRLCLPFSRLRPLAPGAVAVVSQSGGVLLSYLRLLEEHCLGVSAAASLGNKLDLDEVDLIDHLATDPRTRVVFLYLEDIRRGRALCEAARRCGKPIVLYKANRSAATGAAAASHTASLVGDHAVVAAAARQAGIALVDSTESALDAIKARLLPPLRGRRLALATRSGGHAVIGADLCAERGLPLPALPASVEQALAARVRAGVIRFGNPVDLGDLWDMEAYQAVVESLARLDDVDGVVFVFEALTPTDPGPILRLGARLRELSDELAKPIAFCFMSWRENIEALAASLHGWPLFSSVEGAVAALAAVAPPAPTPPAPAVAADRLAALPLAACLELLEGHQLPLATTRLARDDAAAVAAARAIGFPVAVKLLSPEHSHKSDVGGVSLGLADEAAVERACAEMAARLRAVDPAATLEGFCVQAMAPPGLELIVGFRRDPFFGPVVMAGLGGTLVEILRDVALRVAPVSAAEARALLRELAGYPLLQGARGGAALDEQALAELIARFSELAAAAPESLRELELNPVIVGRAGDGCRVVDARAFAAPGSAP